MKPQLNRLLNSRYVRSKSIRRNLITITLRQSSTKLKSSFVKKTSRETLGQLLDPVAIFGDWWHKVSQNAQRLTRTQIIRSIPIKFKITAPLIQVLNLILITILRIKHSTGSKSQRMLQTLTRIDCPLTLTVGIPHIVSSMNLNQAYEIEENLN